MLPRQQLDSIYRQLAGVCGLDDHARHELIEERGFPQALDGGAIYFSLPRSGSQNAEISEQLIAEFGLDTIGRVPGFTVCCKECGGLGSNSDRPCNPCSGLGARRPRFRSARAGSHDFAALASDEEGRVFWGTSRKLPFDPQTETGKYRLLSSSRGMDASLAGLAKYHVAGRSFVHREVWITEGIIKAEITACHLHWPVIGLATAQPDDATTAAVRSLIRGWTA